MPWPKYLLKHAFFLPLKFQCSYRSILLWSIMLWRIRQYYVWRGGAKLCCCPLLLAGVGSLQGAARVDWLEQIHCGMWSVLSPCRGWERLTELRNLVSEISVRNFQEGPTLGNVCVFIYHHTAKCNPSAFEYYRWNPQLMCSGRFIAWSL